MRFVSSFVCVFLAVVIAIAAPVPGQIETVPHRPGRIHRIESDAEVASLSYLLRDCKRCHGIGNLERSTPSRTATWQGVQVFDEKGRVLPRFILTKDARVSLAYWASRGLDDARTYSATSQEHRRDIATAVKWLQHSAR